MRNEMEGNCFAPGGNCATLSLADALLLDGDAVIKRFEFELSILKCLMSLLGLSLALRVLAYFVLLVQVRRSTFKNHLNRPAAKGDAAVTGQDQDDDDAISEAGLAPTSEIVALATAAGDLMEADNFNGLRVTGV